MSRTGYAPNTRNGFRNCNVLLPAIRMESGEIATPNYRRLQQHALNVERDTIIRLRNEHVINDDALRRIQRDLDLAEARLSGD